MKIKAIVSDTLKPFSFKDVELAEPGFDEVMVKIVACGVCHTDATVINGEIPTPVPAVLGHEGAGIVVSVGSGVTSIAPGDHVIIGFSSCGECEHCRTGKNGACDSFMLLNAIGKNRHNRTPLLTTEGEPLSLFFGQSSFATYSTTPASNVIKVDPSLDLRVLGPLGCGLMTGSGTVLNALNPRPGSSIAVFGTGAVGLAGIMAAAIAGCSPIIAVDIHDDRLALALELGATHVVNSAREDAVARITEITGQGAEYSMDTSGVDVVELQALRCLRGYGTMASIALGKKDITLNLYKDLIAKCLTIKGVIEGDAMPQIFIPRLIEFWRAGKFPFDKMIKFYDPADAEQAFADSKSGKVIKPVLVFDSSYQPGL